ncbi:MAG TPA: hypothetical protein DDW84_04760 [Phycisphaerales bacterium]|nr:MAG: hypothetical protein A2Y13_03500 [Planctomycetes bacterium GWC2_45_44]HBG78147.1 hypothetical protein [Phycisphaerales bacterium]HBR19057.1 hypothetical protein [Phycisphaerales bacterium]
MKRDWWNKEFRILMTLGDSITAGGWSSNRDRCWASLLARMITDYQRLPVHLVNLGIGATVLSTKNPRYAASTKPAADERIDDQVLGYTANGAPLLPDLLVIAYGSNDACGGGSIDLFCTEMESILRRIREKIQPLIVLAGPYYMLNLADRGADWSYATLKTFYEYNEATRAMAEKNNCLFADLMSTFAEADWLVHRDLVHSNDLGHRLVANKIFEVLAQNCSGLAMETKQVEEHIVPWRDEALLSADFERRHGKR